MIAFITWTSDYEFNPKNIKEFSTLDELLMFMKDQRRPLVISYPYNWDEEWGPTPDFQIEIYDDYRE